MGNSSSSGHPSNRHAVSAAALMIEGDPYMAEPSENHKEEVTLVNSGHKPKEISMSLLRPVKLPIKEIWGQNSNIAP